MIYVFQLCIEIQNGTKIKEEPIEEPTTSNTDTTEDDTPIVRNNYSLIDHDHHYCDKSLPNNDNSCKTINNTKHRHSSNYHNVHSNDVTNTVNTDRKNVKTKKEIDNTLPRFKKRKYSNEEIFSNENTSALCSVTENFKGKKKHKSITLHYKTKIQRKNKLKKKKGFTCDICFRKFGCLPHWKLHKQYYELGKSNKCRVCNKYFMVYDKLQFDTCRCIHSMRSTYLSAYNCNFCNRSFKNKFLLQSHLFHIHNELICFNGTIKRKTSKSKIFKVNTSPKDDILRTSANKNSLCSNNLVQSEKINTTLTNINKSRNDDVINTEKSRTEKLLNNEVSPSKRLRQPTLTEYLELCKKKRIKLSLSKLNIMKDDFPTCALHRDDQTEKLSEEQNRQSLSTQSDNLLKQTVRSIQKQSMKHETHKKPFVKLHADVEMMKSFLEKLSNTVVEDKITEAGTSNIISYDHGIPYSLRSLNGVSSVKASSNLGMRENKSVSKKSRFDTEFNIKREENGIDLEKVTSKVDWKNIMAHFKCKESTISLTRCDEQPRNSYQISAFKAMKNTCLTPGSNFQESDVRNEVKLKNVEVSLERLIVIPTVHIKEKTPDVEKHNNNYFLCKICKESFSSKLAKRIHIKSSHIAYMSSICSARYKLKHKLLQHYLREHVSKQNQCCICYVLLPDYEALKQHLNVHCLKYIPRQDDQCLVDIELKCNLTKKSKCLHDETFLSRTSLKEHQSRCTVQKEMKEDQKDSMEEGNSYSKDIPEIQHKKTDENIVDITCYERLNPDDLYNPLNSDCAQKSNEDQISLHSKKEQKINEANENILVNNNLIEEKIGTINESQDSERLLENNSIISNQDVANMQLNNIATKNRTYPCDICGKQFQTPKNLEIHVRNFSFTSDVCPMCGTGFSSKRLLQTHITAAHVPHISKTYTFHCVFCNQGFFKKYDLRSHILHLHGQQVLNTLTRNSNINQEKSNESITHSTVCNVCNLVFETHDHYVEHRMYYYKNHTFRCSLCEQNFQGMYMFHHHNKLTHCPEDKRKSYNYICDICHEGFNHESHFYSHNMHVHSNEVNLDETAKESEDIKNRNRDYSSNIQKQIRNCSTDQKKQNEHLSNEYTCQICQIKCRNMDHMVMHKEFYSNDGNFRCDKCNRRCRRFDFLNQHKKLTHSLRDVYNGHMCHICGEILETGISLKCHEKHFHSNITSNNTDNWKNCNQLSSSNIIYPDESKNNTRNVTEYKCLFCDMKFFAPNAVQTHIVHVHIDDIIAKRATLKLALPITNSNSIQEQFEIGQIPSTSSLSSASSSSSSSSSPSSTKSKLAKLLQRSTIQQSNNYILSTMAKSGMNGKTVKLLKDFRTIHSKNTITEKTSISCINKSKDSISTCSIIASNMESKTDISVSSSVATTSRIVAPDTEVGNNASVFLSTGSTIFKTVSNTEAKDNPSISLPESINNLRKGYEISLKSGSTNEFKTNSLAKGSIIINKSKTIPAYLLPTRPFSFKRIIPKPWKSNEITNQKSESVNSYATDHGYSCPLCPLEYPSLMFFHAHLKYAHADSIVSIRTDELTVPQVNESQKASMIECLLCPCTFPDETKYKKHLRNSHTYYVYIPNSQEMTKINNVRNPLTQTNVNRKSTVPETITIDDDDDNVKNTSDQGTAEVTTLNYKEQNEKIGKLRVKPLAKIIENLSMNSASKLL